MSVSRLYAEIGKIPKLNLDIIKKRLFMNCIDEKRSPYGRSITPRARTSMPSFYQTKAIMSTI